MECPARGEEASATGVSKVSSFVRLKQLRRRLLRHLLPLCVCTKFDSKLKRKRRQRPESSLVTRDHTQLQLTAMSNRSSTSPSRYLGRGCGVRVLMLSSPASIIPVYYHYYCGVWLPQTKMPRTKLLSFSSLAKHTPLYNLIRSPSLTSRAHPPLF